MERLTERGEDGKYFVRISGDNDLILGAEERLLPGLEKWTGWWEHTVLGNIVDRLAAYEDILGDKYDLDRLRELVQADREGRCVVLNMPRKPLVWGDGDKNTCLCPYCGKDLMGIPYGERMVLQCPECGQYLDATKVITRAEAALRMEG